MNTVTLQNSGALRSVAIKPLTSDDTDTLHALVVDMRPLTHHTWYTYWTELTCFGNSCFKACAPETDEIVGFVTSHPIRTTPELEWFCWQLGVCQAYRNQGIGTMLLEHVIQTAQTAGAAALQSTIEPNNTASFSTAQHAARQLGVEITKIGEVTTPDGTEIHYRMPLPPLMP